MPRNSADRIRDWKSIVFHTLEATGVQGKPIQCSHCLRELSMDDMSAVFTQSPYDGGRCEIGLAGEDIE